MDTLRGGWDFGDDRSEDSGDEAFVDSPERESPPAPVGQDERRMQVRAYNHWAGAMADRNYPDAKALQLRTLPDFGPHSVLLDFSKGIEDPAIAFLGPMLAHECGVDAGIAQLSDVPRRSLLSRITDHYLQILANQAPIGFEAEFVNLHGIAVLYRGILLPYSSDDETIDTVLGVVNWKELADDESTEQLLREIDRAMSDTQAVTHARADDAIEDWADAPTGDSEELALDAALELTDEDTEAAEDLEEMPVPAALASNPFLKASYSGYNPDFSTNIDGFSDDYDEDEASAYEEGEYEDEDETSLGEDGFPQPSFGSLTGIGFKRALAPEGNGKATVDLGTPIENDGDEDGVTSHPVPQAYEAPEEDFRGLPQAYAPEMVFDDEEYADEAEEPMALDAFEAIDDEPQASPEEIAPEHEPVLELLSAEPQSLADELAAARTLAGQAVANEDRTRGALYAAISRAHDFALSAEAEPDTYAEMLDEAGIAVQERAPMTPVVKLVFGADYDKTRLTEFATALGHARRLELGKGEVERFLSGYDGGLKAVVATERRLRREEKGQASPVRSALAKLAGKLRDLLPVAWNDIARDGEEFALVMVRRGKDGSLDCLGEIPADEALVARAAKQLLG
ncbi:PAS domain-containing protein [Altererythrobacter sp. CAU 1778]